MSICIQIYMCLFVFIFTLLHLDIYVYIYIPSSYYIASVVLYLDNKLGFKHSAGFKYIQKKSRSGNFEGKKQWFILGKGRVAYTFTWSPPKSINDPFFPFNSYLYLYLFVVTGTRAEPRPSDRHFFASNRTIAYIWELMSRYQLLQTFQVILQHICPLPFALCPLPFASRAFGQK